MKMKKILAAVVAAAVSVSAMAVNAFANLEDATAYIMFSDSAWGTQWWDDENTYDTVTAETVKITGDGQYTVKATCAEPATSFAFAALGVANGEVVFGEDTLVITLDSVKIDGIEVKPSGTAYTSSDDDGKNCTRVNIYNGWVSNAPDDARTANNATDMSAAAYDLPSIDTWTTIEVTFTVAGAGAAAEAPATTDAPAADVDTTSTATGNTAAAVMVSVMAVAAAAVVVI